MESFRIGDIVYVYRGLVLPCVKGEVTKGEYISNENHVLKCSYIEPIYGTSGAWVEKRKIK